MRGVVPAGKRQASNGKNKDAFPLLYRWLQSRLFHRRRYLVSRAIGQQDSPYPVAVWARSSRCRCDRHAKDWTRRRERTPPLASGETPVEAWGVLIRIQDSFHRETSPGMSRTIRPRRAQVLGGTIDHGSYATRQSPTSSRHCL